MEHLIVTNTIFPWSFVQWCELPEPSCCIHDNAITFDPSTNLVNNCTAERNNLSIVLMYIRPHGAIVRSITFQVCTLNTSSWCNMDSVEIKIWFIPQGQCVFFCLCLKYNSLNKSTQQSAYLRNINMLYFAQVLYFSGPWRRFAIYRMPSRRYPDSDHSQQVSLLLHCIY